jgi:hypothetical protein
MKKILIFFALTISLAGLSMEDSRERLSMQGCEEKAGELVENSVNENGNGCNENGAPENCHDRGEATVHTVMEDAKYCYHAVEAALCTICAAASNAVTATYNGLSYGVVASVGAISWTIDEIGIDIQKIAYTARNTRNELSTYARTQIPIFEARVLANWDQLNKGVQKDWNYLKGLTGESKQ